MTSYTPEEIAARGDAIYEQHLRDKVEPQHYGQFLILDIESQDYEIDNDDMAATQRLLARHPQGILYGLRIGYAAAYRIGAGLVVEGQRLTGKTRTVAALEADGSPLIGMALLEGSRLSLDVIAGGARTIEELP
jgi:hypothetical protein